MRHKIFLVAGGTGGHLFPAIATSENDRKNNYIFLLDERTKKYVENTNKKYHIIISHKFQKNPIYFPLMILKIFIGFLQSIYLIINHKPKLIVGFGGYTSIPTLLAAKLLGKKILLHEQNAVLGRTNRLLSLVAERVALTFKKTKFADKKAIHTGIPLRKEKQINSSPQKNIFNILVIGGSQGASIFTKLMPKIIKNIKKKHLVKIMLLQQTREEDINDLQNVYKKIGVKFKLKSFFSNIQTEIKNAKIVFSRCGSSTLAEIENHQSFSVLFPLPTAIDNHQYLNALEFQKKNNCIIQNQNNVDYKKVSQVLMEHLFKKNLCKNKLKSTKKISLNMVINDMLN